MEIKKILDGDLSKIKIFLSNETGVGVEKYNMLFNYWWFDNPAYAEKYEKGYILHEKKSDEIVGFIGIYPSFFIYNNNQITVFNLTSWAVNIRYRQHGLGLLLKAMKNDNETLLFDTTPTKQVSKILRKLNFNKFPNPNVKNYYLIIEWYKVLLDFSYISPLVYILKPILFILQSLHIYFTTKNKNMNSDIKVALINGINDEFQKFWKDNNIFQNTNDRSASTLNWYYFHKAIKDKYVLFGFYKKKKLCGFISFNKQKDRLVCVDFFFKKKVQGISILLFSIYEYAKNNKISLVIFPTFNNHLSKILSKKYLFYSTKNQKSDLRFYKFTKSNKRLEKRNTYLSYINGDYGLF